MGKIKTNKEFEQVAILIEEARNRAFHKVNEELVLLYFKVGNIVSAKVAEGIWGDNTVDELASYIKSKYPGLKGFNRRGLYRMKPTTTPNLCQRWRHNYKKLKMKQSHL